MIRVKELVIVGNLAQNKKRTGKIGIVVASAQVTESGKILHHVIFPRGEQAFLFESELKALRLTDAPDQMTLIAPLKDE